MIKPHLSPFDALDAALVSFRAARAAERDISNDELAPSAKSHQKPPVAIEVATLKAAENRHYSTEATKATSNHKIQKPEVHASNKTDVSLHREARVARSLSSQVALVALVEEPQKSACFTAATSEATG
jgi:hypothetical protein